MIHVGLGEKDWLLLQPPRISRRCEGEENEISITLGPQRNPKQDLLTKHLENISDFPFQNSHSAGKETGSHNRYSLTTDLSKL